MKVQYIAGTLSAKALKNSLSTATATATADYNNKYI